MGFSTGDIVRAVVPKGKYTGVWTGRVLTRKSGYFDIKDLSGKRVVQGTSWKNLNRIQRNNGWLYGRLPIPPTAKAVGFLGARS